MADEEIHLDVAAYALGQLEPGDAARFEQHLAGCERCRSELAELAPAAGALALAAPAAVPPPDLQARTFMAIERAAAGAAMAPRFEEPPARASRRFRLRPGLRLAFAGAAVAAVALVAGLLGFRAGEERQPGELELDVALVSPERGARGGSARVTETGIGRVVAIESDALPVLDNEREFYEVWFVAPGDAPGDPNRVSAGTFHPDEQGRTSVRLAAAVVPADYPTLSVTREPRDGDPRPTGPEVLRSDKGS